MMSEAFRSMGGDPHDEGRLEWPAILAILESMGERISEDELSRCLQV